MSPSNPAAASADVSRLLYQQRQYLGARDFTDEQQYFLRMRRLHWVSSHVWGILSGLTTAKDATTGAWAVAPGLAVDAWGREILVPRPLAIDPKAVAGEVPAAVARPALVNMWLWYCAEPARPPKGNYGDCEQSIQFTRIRETYRLGYTLSGADPQFDPPGGAEPAAHDPAFARDMEAARWPLFLGQVKFGPDGALATDHVLDVSGTDATKKWSRREIGRNWVAAGDKVHVRAVTAPDPLPAAHAGVTLQVDGSATVARDAVVNGALLVAPPAPAKDGLELRPAALKFYAPDGSQVARVWVDGGKLNFCVGPGPAAQVSLDAAGLLTVKSLASGNPKAFRVDHPSRAGMRLTHAALEGPEAGVYYRGEGRLSAGESVVTLPDYFEQLALKSGRTVQVTPRFAGRDEPLSALAASAVEGGAFTVRALDAANPSQAFYWEVKGVRADQPPLVVESPPA